MFISLYRSIKHIIKSSTNTVLKPLKLQVISLAHLENLKTALNATSLTSHQFGNNSKTPTIQKPYQDLQFSSHALQKLIKDYDFQTILDVGSGSGTHSKVLLDAGKLVTSIDFGKSVYFENRGNNYNVIQANYYQYKFPEPFDAIWASHVLEHQPNSNLFLKKINKDLKEGGILAITVPPLKHEIVGGHLSLWNAGLLLYHLVFAGFDCKNASILKYGYNISVILRKESIPSFPDLNYDTGDIEKLLPYFPEGFTEPFNGDICELNWFGEN